MNVSIALFSHVKPTACLKFCYFISKVIFQANSICALLASFRGFELLE